ncbi:MAG TPA: DCC1-like thiol-disulfide oxidoreductase family protein [Actinomycetes bacterium]
MTPSRPTMLYDGACGFCTRAVEVALERLPDRVTWVPYQSVDLAAYGVSEAEAARSLHLVDPSGRVEHGAAAVARLLVVSGGAWALLGAALLAPPLSWLAEVGYRLVGLARGRLPGSTPALARLPEDRPGARRT